MIAKRDGLRHEYKVIKSELKKAIAHFKKLKENPKKSAKPRVLVVPSRERHDPNIPFNSNPSVAVNAAISAATPSTSKQLLPALSVQQQSSDLEEFYDLPAHVNFEACEDIQDFVKYMYVVSTDSHENSIIVRRQVTGERSMLSSFVDSADVFCRQRAEDPTLRPYYSEVDPVNVRKSILRSHPLPTDFYKPEDFASNG